VITRREFLKLAGIGVTAAYLPFAYRDNVTIIRDTQDFIEALADDTIAPGSILELADGTYAGDFTSEFAGTEAEPIIVRPFDPGKVIIDGPLAVNDVWTHWYDLDFTDTRADRTFLDTGGITMNPVGTRFHGCSIIDTVGEINWFGSGIGEVSECIIYNNLGHAIYTHNNDGGERIIARNIFGNQLVTGLSGYALHIYSAGANYLKDYKVYDNVTCGYPAHTGGGYGLIDFVYRNNIHFGDYVQHGRYTIDEGEGYHNIRGSIQNNEMVGLSSWTINQGNDLAWEELTEEGNIFYGDAYPATYEPVDASGYSLVAQPETKVWITAFTKSARWLGMVTIYNRDSATTVSVDLSGLLANGIYRLRNGQNMTETWEFTQTGIAINVPMNIWTPSHVIGEGDGENHLPIFGAFVVEKVDVSNIFLPIVSKKLHYVHPLANSLLDKTLVSELGNYEYDGKNYYPYGKRH
jgi:hypothetical protein